VYVIVGKINIFELLFGCLLSGLVWFLVLTTLNDGAYVTFNWEKSRSNPFLEPTSTKQWG